MYCIEIAEFYICIKCLVFKNIIFHNTLYAIEYTDVSQSQFVFFAIASAKIYDIQHQFSNKGY